MTNTHYILECIDRPSFRWRVIDVTTDFDEVIKRTHETMWMSSMDDDSYRTLIALANPSVRADTQAYVSAVAEYLSKG